jgi:hypothetical protein
MVFVKEGDLCGLARLLPKEFDGFAPGRFLTSVEFAEVKHLPLKHTLSRDAAVFDYTPIEVFFAIFTAIFAAEEHAP